jgi:hypothetical protein
VYYVIMHKWFGINQTMDNSMNDATSSSGCSSISSGFSHCAAIQDDFDWWHRKNDESDTSGKLLLVDSSAAATVVADTGVAAADQQAQRIIQVPSFLGLSFVKFVFPNFSS